MESVVKAVGLPVNFLEVDNLEEKHDDEVPTKPDNIRKRRYSSEEEYRRERKEHYEIGTRYWGDEGPKDNYFKHSKEEDHHSRRRRENQPRNDRKIDGMISVNEKDTKEPRKIKEMDPVLTRTGGAYIPPAKLRMMQAQITDKSSLAFQRLAWEALKKSIHGLINKVNVSNIPLIITSLFKENIVRGRGLLTRSVIQAQAASPTFTHVYAALAALINSKFPNIGELLLTRLILQFRRGFRRNDKQICMSSTGFIAHLVNQQLAHELLALEILTLLLENATDDSVEVAVGFLKECGQKLGEVTPRGLTAVFDRLRHVLHEAELDKRIKYMIEVMFQVRKDGFKDNPAVMTDLDLVEDEDQFTHLMSIQEEELDPQDMLNVFKHDPEYEANEEKYQAVKIEIIGDDSGDSVGSGEENEESDGDDVSEEEAKEEGDIVDETETNLIALRRTIYLTIQSSLDHNECAHKMMKMQMKPGQETELCHMILDCCTQQRTYEKFFGLLAQRFCQINKSYIPPFEQMFHDTYDTIHRLDTNKLRNVAKMFAHLLFTDAISWQVMTNFRLTEEDTTSSSRIFLKILFQELAEYMGLSKLNLRLKDPTLQTYFEGVFPRDDPRNTRFAINFFTSIGLGGLTDELREHLRTHPKPPPITVPAPVSSLSAAAAQLLLEDSDSDSSSSSSSSTSSSSDGDDDDEKTKQKSSRVRKSSADRYSKSGRFPAHKRNREDNKSTSKHGDDPRGNHEDKERSRQDGRHQIRTNDQIEVKPSERRERSSEVKGIDTKHSDDRARQHSDDRARQHSDGRARQHSDDRQHSKDPNKNRKSRPRHDYENEYSRSRESRR